MNNTILVIEDDRKAAQILKIRLETAGYGCETCSRGDRGLEALTSRRFKAAIVDLALPGLSGGELIQKARDAGIDIPIIILTANTEEVALTDNLGKRANDFVRKPYRINELLCRLAIRIAEHDAIEGNLLRHGKIAFDTLSKTVSCEAIRFSLPSFEAAIFEFLLRNWGKVQSKDVIRAKVWGPDRPVDPKTVIRTVGRLNAILEAYGLPCSVINKRDVGYVIE